MTVKEDLKKVAEYEVKSNFHKGKIVVTVAGMGLKKVKKSAQFIGRYIKELRSEK